MSQPQPIQWVEKTVRLTELRPFEHNPRTITESQFAKLKQSIAEDGYHSRIKVTHDFRVVGGHQRLRAMQELGYESLAVLVPSRPLGDEEFKRILLRDNHHNGAWDMDALSGMFDVEELRKIGLTEIMNIPPIEENEEPGRYMVTCPGCKHTFPVKGNKHVEG